MRVLVEYVVHQHKNVNIYDQEERLKVYIFKANQTLLKMATSELYKDTVVVNLVQGTQRLSKYTFPVAQLLPSLNSSTYLRQGVIEKFKIKMQPEIETDRPVPAIQWEWQGYNAQGSSDRGIVPLMLFRLLSYVNPMFATLNLITLAKELLLPSMLQQISTDNTQEPLRIKIDWGEENVTTPREITAVVTTFFKLYPQANPVPAITLQPTVEIDPEVLQQHENDSQYVTSLRKMNPPKLEYASRVQRGVKSTKKQSSKKKAT